MITAAKASVFNAQTRTVGVASPARARVSRRDLRWIAGGAALVVLVALLLVVSWPRPACCGDAARPARPAQTGAPAFGSRSGGDASAGAGGTPAPSAPPGAATPGVAGGPDAPPSENAGRQPSASAVASAPATRPVVAGAGGLRATYSTSKPSLVGLLGYQGRITLSNPTSEPVGSWTVVLELRGNNEVTDSHGALYMRRDGHYVFIPAGAGTLAPGATYEFTFDVGGLLTGPPVSCTVDERPCG